jgi:hypothetical protein
MYYVTIFETAVRRLTKKHKNPLTENSSFLANANYPQELAQDAVCRSHTGHMTGLWFLPARPLRLNTNELMNE